MGRKVIINKNDIFKQWKVLEPNVVKPDSKNKAYMGKPLFSLCECQSCHKTTRYILNSELASGRSSNQCNNCATIARNIANREVQIGKRYGYLEVIQDAGYEEQQDGKRRHYSWCKCHFCNRQDLVKIMDNQLQTGNTISCGCIISKGEAAIQAILKENNIIFQHDKGVEGIKEESGFKLRFDFIIYDEQFNIIRFVEFDGEQHKKGFIGGFWSNADSFEKLKERDKAKDEYCLNKGIPLVRIPYSRLSKLTLEDIMGDKYLVKERQVMTSDKTA